MLRYLVCEVGGRCGVADVSGRCELNGDGVNGHRPDLYRISNGIAVRSCGILLLKLCTRRLPCAPINTSPRNAMHSSHGYALERSAFNSHRWTPKPNTSEEAGAASEIAAHKRPAPFPAHRSLPSARPLIANCLVAVDNRHGEPTRCRSRIRRGDEMAMHCVGCTRARHAAAMSGPPCTAGPGTEQFSEVCQQALSA